MDKKKGATPLQVTPFVSKIRKKNLKAKTLKLFLSGEILTAEQVDRIIGGSDARKRISVLRKEGIDISDCWLPDHSRKIYFLKDGGRKND